MFVKKKKERREKIKNGIWFFFRAYMYNNKKNKQIQKAKQKSNKQAEKPKQNKTKI